MQDFPQGIRSAEPDQSKALETFPGLSHSPILKFIEIWAHFLSCPAEHCDQTLLILLQLPP